MDLELACKAAIVTGGSAGIGKAIALELAREGVDVAICGRRPGPLEDAAIELAQETGRRVVAIPADTTVRESVERMVEHAYSVLGRMDILVNNAAFPGGLVTGPLAEASEEALLEDVNTKVMGYFRCAKAVEPHMRRQGGSISGLRNAAIVHLTKTLSEFLGPFGITVNLIHPGTTRTERSDPMYAEQARREGVTAEEIEGRVAQDIAIRRIVDAREIGYVVCFLTSPKATCVTGEVVAAGGGSMSAVFQ